MRRHLVRCLEVAQVPHRGRLCPIRAHRRQLLNRRLCRPTLIRRVSEFSAVARLRLSSSLRCGVAPCSKLVLSRAVCDLQEVGDDAHITAAPAMFLCIVVVACINAWRSQPQRKVLNYRNAYIAIAVGMLATIVATAVIAIAGGFSHLTIWIEVALIGLFAVFWVLQTIELWKPGLRQPTAVQLAESS